MNRLRSLGRWGLVGLMLFPLLLALVNTGLPALPPLTEFFAVLFQAFEQATLSAVLSLVLGTLGALGLCAIPTGPALALLEAMVLFPTWIPPLFVILAVLSVVTSLAQFPFGLPGVIFIHALMNTGFVAVAVARLVRARLGGQAELAYVEGAKRWAFLRWGLWPQLRRELGLIALVVFGLCFTSFSVPLIVGGVRATTLEIYIYQALHSGHQFEVAVGVGLVQMLILSILAWGVGSSSTTRSRAVANLNLIGLHGALLVPLTISFGLMVGSGWHWPQGWAEFKAWPELQAEFFPALLRSLLLSLGVGGGVILLLLLTAVVSPHAGLRRWLLGYSMPSTVLMGLALMTVGPVAGPWVLAKVGLGLTLLFFPPLYRWLGDGSLHALESQVGVARTLGATWGQILGRIVVPQWSRDLGLMAGLAALWTSGDFALTGLLTYQDLTAALVVDDVLSSYRLELATWLMMPVLGVGLSAGVFFWGVGYVTSRKLSSGLR